MRWAKTGLQVGLIRANLAYHTANLFSAREFPDYLFMCGFVCKNVFFLTPVTNLIIYKFNVILKYTKLFYNPHRLICRKTYHTDSHRGIIAFIKTNKKAEIISGGFVRTVHWHVL